MCLSIFSWPRPTFCLSASFSCLHLHTVLLLLLSCHWLDFANWTFSRCLDWKWCVHTHTDTAQDTHRLPPSRSRIELTLLLNFDTAHKLCRCHFVPLSRCPSAPVSAASLHFFFPTNRAIRERESKEIKLREQTYARYGGKLFPLLLTTLFVWQLVKKIRQDYAALDCFSPEKSCAHVWGPLSSDHMTVSQSGKTYYYLLPLLIYYRKHTITGKVSQKSGLFLSLFLHFTPLSVVDENENEIWRRKKVECQRGQLELVEVVRSE